jgi:hypothetical protein
MAKDIKEAVPEPTATPESNLVAYARFHMPMQVPRVLNGVHSDTSKLPKGSKLWYDQIGLHIEYDGHKILVGWPNIHFTILP